MARRAVRSAFLILFLTSLNLAESSVSSSIPQAAQAYAVSGLELQMAWIEPGAFTIGSPESENGRQPDERQLSVTIADGFWIGACETTVDQWERFIAETGYKTEAERGEGVVQIVEGQWLPVAGTDWRSPGFAQTGAHPVVGVAWSDALAFCQWLTQRERSAGRLPPQFEYTLPTEAQWEYACRAGSGGAFIGDDGANIKEEIRYRFGDGLGRILSESNSHPVGTLRPNAWGLHDVHGNVFEWCRDWYGEYQGEAATDPLGPSTGTQRICRGGSWYSNFRYVRSAYRGREDPARACSNIGFRVCLSEPQ